MVWEISLIFDSYPLTIRTYFHRVAGYYGIRLAVRVCFSLSVRPSVVHLSILSFPDYNLSKCQCIFTKLNVCIDIVEILFGIVNGQISSISDCYLPTIRLYFHRVAGYYAVRLAVHVSVRLSICSDNILMCFKIMDTLVYFNGI